MKIYIAGPISNISGYKRNFAAAERLIKKKYKDCIVLNPTILPEGLAWGEYMQICKPMIQIADLVVFIDGWMKETIQINLLRS